MSADIREGATESRRSKSFSAPNFLEYLNKCWILYFVLFYGCNYHYYRGSSSAQDWYVDALPHLPFRLFAVLALQLLLFSQQEEQHEFQGSLQALFIVVRLTFDFHFSIQFSLLSSSIDCPIKNHSSATSHCDVDASNAPAMMTVYSLPQDISAVWSLKMNQYATQPLLVSKRRHPLYHNHFNTLLPIRCWVQVWSNW